jgi:uncharacterized membrane protein
MEVILDILWASVIFGALATVPIVTWLAVAWLVTDRRRPSARPDSS